MQISEPGRESRKDERVTREYGAEEDHMLESIYQLYSRRPSYHGRRGMPFPDSRRLGPNRIPNACDLGLKPYQTRSIARGGLPLPSHASRIGQPQSSLLMV